MAYRVVFHVNQNEPGPLATALHNIENLLKALDGASADIRVLANGPAVKLFTQDQDKNTADTITDLAASGVAFLLCRNALNGNKIEDGDLLAVTTIVPAGIVALIEMQQDGIAYIKP